MNFWCSFVILVLVICDFPGSGAVVDSDSQEAKSILLSVLGSLKDSRNDGGRYGSQTGWDKYHGDQTESRGGGGVDDDNADDADLDKAISVLTKAVGDVDQGLTSVRITNNKPEVTSSVTRITNSQEIPAKVVAIIDSALGNLRDNIPDSVVDMIKSATSQTSSYTNQDDKNDVERAYNSATGNTNQGIPANLGDIINYASNGNSNSRLPDNFADIFKSFPSTNGNSFNDVQTYSNAGGSNVDVAKIMQDAFTNAGDNKQGKWQKLSNGNYFKSDHDVKVSSSSSKNPSGTSFEVRSPSVHNYRDFKVSTSNSNPGGSNIDVNNILKNVKVSNSNSNSNSGGSNVDVDNILKSALGKAGNAQTWQNSYRADTPSVQNYRDVQVSTGSFEGSNVDVNKVIKNAIGNAGVAQTWQNSYKADTPLVQNYRDVQVSTGNSDGSNVDVDKVIQDATGNAGVVPTWQISNPGSGGSNSDNSNTDVGKLLQDAFAKYGNGQQSSWPNFANVNSYQNNNKPDVQVSSTSVRRTYTNTNTEPKQVKSLRGSYTNAPNYGATSGSSWRQNDAGKCLIQQKLCKVGSDEACCAPLCCTRLVSGSGGGDFGLCKPRTPGMTCDRR